MCFNPVNDRIATIRIQCKPINIIVVYLYLYLYLQVYAPISRPKEDNIETIYEIVQSVIDQTTSRDVLYIIVDWNSKVWKYISKHIIGNFGLGERNERGYQLVEFLSRNDHLIMNTLFKLHPRLYT